MSASDEAALDYLIIHCSGFSVQRLLNDGLRKIYKEIYPCLLPSLLQYTKTCSPLYGFVTTVDDI